MHKKTKSIPTQNRESGFTILTFVMYLAVLQCLTMAAIIGFDARRANLVESSKAQASWNSVGFLVRRYISMPEALRNSIVSSYIIAGLNSEFNQCVTGVQPMGCMAGQPYPLTLYDPANRVPISGPGPVDSELAQPQAYNRKGEVCPNGSLESDCPIRAYTYFTATCANGALFCTQADSIQINYSLRYQASATEIARVADGSVTINPTAVIPTGSSLTALVTTSSVVTYQTTTRLVASETSDGSTLVTSTTTPTTIAAVEPTTTMPPETVTVVDTTAPTVEQTSTLDVSTTTADSGTPGGTTSTDSTTTSTSGSKRGIYPKNEKSVPVTIVDPGLTETTDSTTTTTTTQASTSTSQKGGSSGGSKNSTTRSTSTVDSQTGSVTTDSSTQTATTDISQPIDSTTYETLTVTTAVVTTELVSLVSTIDGTGTTQTTDTSTSGQINQCTSSCTCQSGEFFYGGQCVSFGGFLN